MLNQLLLNNIPIFYIPVNKTENEILLYLETLVSNNDLRLNLNEYYSCSVRIERLCEIDITRFIIKGDEERIELELRPVEVELF
jgi:hypothetical protein